MFGAQGLAQSRDFSWEAGTICGAPIKVSYYVFAVFGFKLFQIFRSVGSAGGATLLFYVLEAVGAQLILMLTVLCHEFGHGNMARYLGGQIDHILLWVFGGICFHTRPPAERDSGKTLRNDLLVVAAGPGTHFLQAPVWGLALLGIFAAGGAQLLPGGAGGAWAALLSAMNPFGVSDGLRWPGPQTWAEWALLLAWTLARQGVWLNVSLFLFNVFFPMYPADGAKLLVTSLMFFCRVPPRAAALALVCTSVPCAALLMCWAAVQVFSGGVMGGMMGWMGVMSLQEAKRIWDLRQAKRLHTHPLFELARSWQRTERDAFGHVTRINTGDLDDDQVLSVPPSGRGSGGAAAEPGSWACAGCLSCALPCLFRPAAGRRGGAVDAAEAETPGSYSSQCSPPGVQLSPETAPPSQQAVRELRAQLLSGVGERQAERQRTVRELQESGRCAGSSVGPPLRCEEDDCGSAA